MVAGTAGGRWFRALGIGMEAAEPEVFQDVGPYRVALHQLLGRGGQVSGEGEGVFAAEDTRSGDRLAVKRVAFARCRSSADDDRERRGWSKYERLKREVENAWRLSGHPNVVSLVDVRFAPRPDGTEDREFLCLVMELGEGSDLFARVSGSGAVGEPEAAEIFKQVMVGVQHVHAMGVCHRDLKLENVLVSGDSVKLADFGMSKDFWHSIANTYSDIGTLAYLAPELFERGGWAGGEAAYAPEPVDVWAAGVMLFVMTCAKYPFGTGQRAVHQDGEWKWISDAQSKMDTSNRIRAGEPSAEGSAALRAVSPELQDLLRACLTVDPAARITVDAVLSHPWLARATYQPAAAAPERPFDWRAFWPEQAEVDAAAAIAIPGAASFDSDEMLGSSIGSSLPGTLGSLLLEMSPGFPDTMHGGSGSGSGSGSGESGGGLPRAPSGSPRVSPPDGAPADPGFGAAFALPSFDDAEREAAMDS